MSTGENARPTSTAAGREQTLSALRRRVAHVRIDLRMGLGSVLLGCGAVLITAAAVTFAVAPSALASTSQSGAALAAPASSSTPSPSRSPVGGNEVVRWMINHAPSAGLTTITFPMIVHPAMARTSGQYFAQQLFFNGGGGAYIGLQPRANLANGQPRLHAAFSVFIAGSTFTDPHCWNGADGGSGVSCSVDFNAIYGDTYNLVVLQTSLNTWSGTVVDATTNTTVPQIGEWTIPSTQGLIEHVQLGVHGVYYQGWSCDALKRYDVTFGAPYSGAPNGVTTFGGRYNGCDNGPELQSITVGTGVRLVRGTSGVVNTSPTINGTVEASTVNAGTPAIHGTAVGPAQSTVRVSQNGQQVSVATVASDLTWSCQPTSAFADGAHSVIATQTDPDGVVSEDSASRTFSVSAPMTTPTPTPTQAPTATPTHTASSSPTPSPTQSGAAVVDGDFGVAIDLGVAEDLGSTHVCLDRLAPEHWRCHDAMDCGGLLDDVGGPRVHPVAPPPRCRLTRGGRTTGRVPARDDPRLLFVPVRAGNP